MAGLYTPYVRLGTTGNYATQVDNALNANGAVNYANPLGTLYAPPINTGALTTANGAGAPPVLKYVQYLSTANPAPQAFPSVVYWKDETFTVVTGVESESLGPGVNSVAGILLVNTTSVSTLTATVLSNSGNGVGVWIQVGGFCAGVAVPAAVAIGDMLIGAAGNWTMARIAAGSAITNTVVGRALSAIAANNTADLLLNGLNVFWGS